MVPAEKRCAGARESGEEFVGGARGMRATILEKAELSGWRPPWATSKKKYGFGS